MSKFDYFEKYLYFDRPPESIVVFPNIKVVTIFEDSSLPVIDIPMSINNIYQKTKRNLNFLVRESDIKLGFEPKINASLNDLNDLNLKSLKKYLVKCVKNQLTFILDKTTYGFPSIHIFRLMITNYVNNIIIKRLLSEKLLYYSHEKERWLFSEIDAPDPKSMVADTLSAY